MESRLTPSTDTRPIPVQLMAEPGFLRLWIVGGLVGTMRWLDVLVVGIYVLEVSGSAFQVALAMFFRTLPMFLFGAISGAYAETVSKRKLLIGTIAGMACTYGLLCWFAVTGVLEFWHLLIGVFYSGVIRTTEMPIRRAMIAEIIDLKRASSAMGLDTSTNNFTRMLGPFLGGFVFEFFGLDGALIIGAILHAAAAWLLMNIDAGHAPSEAEKTSTFINIVDGFRFIQSNTNVKAILVITVVMNFFGFSYMALGPVIAREDLGLSAVATGIVLSCEGAGAFIAAFALSFVTIPRRANQVFFGGAVLLLGGVVVYASSGAFLLAAGALWVAGMGMAGFGTMQWALIIANSPPEMRTRIMGVLTMCIGVTPAGILCTGFLAERFGAGTAVIVMALCGTVCMIVAAVIWPVIIKARGPS